jgi:AmpD protein
VDSRGFDPKAPGWLARARRCPSPNHDRRPEVAIDTLVIHFISLPPGRFAMKTVEDFFCNRLDVHAHPDLADIEGLRVSSHFLIGRRGELVQFVSCDDRAWHAGVSVLLGRSACNDFSIGIEMVGDERHRFTRRQYARLATTVAVLRRRYRLRFAVGHADVAPGRKIDPGPYFDWDAVLALPAFAGLERPSADAAGIMGIRNTRRSSQA